MQKYRFELILASLFVALYLAFAHWQAPGSKLTVAEIDGYVQRIEQGISFMPAAGVHGVKGMMDGRLITSI